MAAKSRAGMRAAGASRTTGPVRNEPGKVPARQPARKLDKLIPCLLTLAGILAYFNCLHAPFILDDRYHIVENARIRHLWPLWPVIAHTSRPIVNFTLALNYALGGLDPAGYHIFNIAVHILAALVLYGIVRRTLTVLPSAQRNAQSTPWLAGLVAAIWLVHPIQTESVTYTIQRGESLMGLFYLLTVYCVIRAAESRNSFWWPSLAVVSCLLGMATKGGIMATAPVLALLFDRVFISGSWMEVAKRRWGLYASLAATWLAYPFLLAAAPEEWKESAGFQYGGATPWQYAMTQPKVILHYLRLVIWPDQLCLDYGWPVVRSIAEASPYVFVLAALIAAIAWAWRKKPQLAFLGTAFFLILIPTSSFIPIADVAVEHRMYLPLAPLVILFACGLFFLSSLRVVWICGVLILVALIPATIRRNVTYASEISIWEDTVEKSPGNPRGHYDLGVAQEEAGDFTGALSQYQRAVELNPAYPDALANLGHLLLVSGRAGDAIPYLQKAIQVQPNLAAAHNILALALAQQGNVADAVLHWKEAVRIKPDYAEPHNNLGIIWAQQGHIQEAIDEWQQALKYDSSLADAHNNLAYTLWQQGRNQEAIEHFEQALRLHPNSFQAEFYLAKMLSTLPQGQGRDAARAVALAQQACDLAGHRDAACLDLVAGAYAAAGKRDEAERAAQNAVELARTAGQADLARQIETRLERYRGGRDYFIAEPGIH